MQGVPSISKLIYLRGRFLRSLKENIIFRDEDENKDEYFVYTPEEIKPSIKVSGV